MQIIFCKKMKEAANGGGLMQLRRNRREFGIQLSTKAVHDRDDGECDARSDESIFNGCSPGFIFQKRQEPVPHELFLPWLKGLEKPRRTGLGLPVRVTGSDTICNPGNVGNGI
jgi:hypothetical protein